MTKEFDYFLSTDSNIHYEQLSVNHSQIKKYLVSNLFLPIRRDITPGTTSDGAVRTDSLNRTNVRRECGGTGSVKYNSC